jgi:hypothetical protein
LEEMIENDVMEELERRVRNRVNEVQGVWRIGKMPTDWYYWWARSQQQTFKEKRDPTNDDETW